MRFNIQNLACISCVKGLTQLESVQSVQSLNHVQLFATPWTCSTPGLKISVKTYPDFYVCKFSSSLLYLFISMAP